MKTSIESILNSRLEGYENYKSISPVNMTLEERGEVMRRIKELHPELRVGCCEFFKLGYCIYTL